MLDEIFGDRQPAGSVQPWPGEPLPTLLDPGLRAVLERVEAGDSVSEIAAATGMPVAEVRAALGRLEREGHIVAGALGWYERAAGGVRLPMLDGDGRRD